MESFGAEAGPAPRGKPVGNVWYGTCSWTDPTLLACGSFYPRSARTPEARLRHYAREFPLVEVDATYYAPPSQDNARVWAERTPEGFVFDLKAYGLLTQHPVETPTLPPDVRAALPASSASKPRVYLSHLPPEARARVFETHVEALRPLADAGKLGALLFQFPHWFRATRAHEDYLREVRERLPWSLAVEFRGGGWMTEERRARTLELLETLQMTYVVVDEPQGFRSSTPPVVAATDPLAMVRFHGRNAETWEQRGLSAAERFRYLYAEPELREWVPRVRELARSADRVHALMNNCYADYGVRGARQLAALLAEAAEP